MDRIEWTKSADSLRDYDTEQARAVAFVSNPIINQLVQKIELPSRTIEAEKTSTEAVITKIVELAESNHLIERVLDRKHEVKDFAATALIHQHFTSTVDSILKAKSPQSISSQHFERFGKNTRSKTGLLTSLPPHSLYSVMIRYVLICTSLALATAVIFVILFT